MGYADPESHRVADQDTNFALASITKSFVDALVLRLVESKDIVLDAPIADQLPGPLAIDLNRATVRQALANRSGIRNYWQPAMRAALAADPQREWTPSEVLSFGGGADFAPGERWAYSNTNFVVLGLLVEAATGREVGTTTHESFITPSGLEGFAYQPRFLASEPHARGVALGAAPGTFDLLPVSGVSRTWRLPAPWVPRGVWPVTLADLRDGGARYTAATCYLVPRWTRCSASSTLATAIDTASRRGLSSSAVTRTWLSGEIIGYTSVLLSSARRDTSVAVVTNAPHDAMALAAAVTSGLVHRQT